MTDVQYFNFHKRNIGNLLADVYSILKEVDLIYTTTDWLDRNVQFTVGVRLQKITVFTSNASAGAIDDNVTLSGDYLAALANRSLDGYCAGFGFAGREFKENNAKNRCK